MHACNPATLLLMYLALMMRSTLGAPVLHMQEVLVGKQLRIFLCGAPLRRSMVGWMASVLADLDSLLLMNHH